MKVGLFVCKNTHCFCGIGFHSLLGCQRQIVEKGYIFCFQHGFHQYKRSAS